MRHFVRDDRRHDLARSRRAVFGVDEQCYFPIGDSPPVLHRARREVGYGDVVELGEGIRDSEVVVEVVKQRDGRIEREPPFVFAAANRPHAHQNAVPRPLFHAREIANDERQQIRRHDGRFGESDGFLPRRAHAHRNRLRVGYGFQLFRDDEGYVESRLDRRLVPARERAARVGGFELRGSHPPPLAVCVGVRGPVESAQLVVELPGELRPQLRRAGRDGEGERDGDRLALFVVTDSRRPVGRAVRQRNRRRVDLQLRAVERNLPNLARDFYLDALRPRKRERFEIRLQNKRVARRSDVLRQSPFAGG